MNELHRQMYLAALGVDTYMPRWHLPFAPISVVCELPGEEITTSPSPEVITLVSNINNVLVDAISPSVTPNVRTSDPTPINNLIGDIFESKKSLRSTSESISSATILAQLNNKSSDAIAPFSLSVWRPAEGVMIVDSRNTKLALPTELLLNNVLRHLFPGQTNKLQEEVLRWPMIENSIAKPTENDARNELQTWLSVQNEIKPIRYLWLMGANAATYILPEGSSFADSVFQSVVLDGISVKALILPSLNELLQAPSSKRKLFSVLSNYHLK